MRPHYAPGVPDEVTIPDEPLTNLLDEAVRDFPSRVAIDFIGATMTYRELSEQVKKAASLLSMAGVRKGDAVAVILPNCPQHVVLAYAVWSLGAVLAEHNPLAPAREIKAQLENHGGTVIFAWEKTIDAVGDIFNGYTVFSVDLTRHLPLRSRLLLRLPVKAARAQREKMRAEVPAWTHSFDDLLAISPTEYFGHRPDANDIAVYLHTGGTTGTPKAVCLTHRNLYAQHVQTVAWMPHFDQGKETIGSVLPFFHAFGLTLSLVLAVGSAATQDLLPTFDPDMLIAANKRHPITFFGGVPPMYDKIVDAMKPDSDFSALRYSVAGAMPVDPELARRWEEATDSYLIEGYGMTEAAPVISGSPVSPDRRPSTLGLPFPSVEVKIVDPENIDRIVEDGEVGEIMARGPNIFAGYLNNEEETNHALVDGWLRTGDLGKWVDGFLVMADRRKEMIISSGFNIYPSQVEAQVRQMPGVADCAVVGVPDGSRGEEVVAALVLEPGASVDLDQVRRWLSDRISHYAMPRSVAVFDELPRSQLGKVMRRRVREQLDNFDRVGGHWRKKFSESSDELRERMSDTRERMSDAADDLRERMSDTRERMSETADEFRQRVSETADEIKERVSETADDFRGRAQDRRDRREASRHAAHTEDDAPSAPMPEPPTFNHQQDSQLD